MIDIQSAMAENRQGITKEEREIYRRNHRTKI